MTRNVRSALTLVTGLALAFTALPARADDDHDHDRRDRDGWHDRDHDRDHDRARPVHVPPVVVYAPPVVHPAPAPVYRPARWEGRARLRELQAEYQRLDEARAQFYATWRGNPLRRDRFEAWYGSRRAELDRRRSELQAWR